MLIASVFSLLDSCDCVLTTIVAAFITELAIDNMDRYSHLYWYVGVDIGSAKHNSTLSVRTYVSYNMSNAILIRPGLPGRPGRPKFLGGADPTQYPS
jgi:hypothetical protein